jgi:dolichol-phosphate mannosyltransferase
MKIESHGGFEIGMEIAIKEFLKGYKIAEMPSIWQGRADGKSRFRFRQWLLGYTRRYLHAITGRFKNTRGLPAFPI